MKFQNRSIPRLRALDDLIPELDHPKYAVREKATRDLRSWGETARPALALARADSPSAEKLRRIDQLLKEIGRGVPAARLVPVRSLEVLERIGGPSARALIERLTKDSDPWLVEEGRRTLERMAK